MERASEFPGGVGTFGEALTRLHSAADEVLNMNGESRVVAIEGPTGSGKTELIRCLYEHASSKRLEYWPEALSSEQAGQASRERLFPLRSMCVTDNRMRFFWWGLHGGADRCAAVDEMHQITGRLEDVRLALEGTARGSAPTKRMIAWGAVAVLAEAAGLIPAPPAWAAVANSIIRSADFARTVTLYRRRHQGYKTMLEDPADPDTPTIDLSPRSWSTTELAWLAALLRRLSVDLPLVVVVDDAQMLDRATSAFLANLVGPGLDDMRANLLVVWACQTPSRPGPHNPGPHNPGPQFPESVEVTRLVLDARPGGPRQDDVLTEEFARLPEDDRTCLSIAAQYGPAVPADLLEEELLDQAWNGAFRRQAGAVGNLKARSSNLPWGSPVRWAAKTPATYTFWSPRLYEIALAHTGGQLDRMERTRLGRHMLDQLTSRQVDRAFPPPVARSLLGAAIHHGWSGPVTVANAEGAWTAPWIALYLRLARDQHVPVTRKSVEDLLRQAALIQQSAVLAAAVAEHLHDLGGDEEVIEAWQSLLEEGAGDPDQAASLRQTLGVLHATIARRLLQGRAEVALREKANIHYKAAIKHFDQAGLHPDYRTAIKLEARLHADFGHYDNAVNAMEQYRTNLPDGAHEILTARYWIARWTNDAGRPLEALGLAQSLMRDQARILGEYHLDTLATRYEHARYTGEVGEAAGALALYKGLLPDRERVLDSDDRDVLITRHQVAFCTGMVGEAAGALALYKGLLPDRERVLGPDDRDVLTTRHQVAFCTGKTGDAAGALAMFEGLLPDQERVLGPEHEDCLRTRHEIAFYKDKLGGAAEATG
ncbi:MAG: AAA family ATPase [Propionibacteriaceae bacterium]|jgi:tetratricopeptide (TPR) repeat protein|nr:AAA family ATPase [Propionibacteriaceae bacterium]